MFFLKKNDLITHPDLTRNRLQFCRSRIYSASLHPDNYILSMKTKLNDYVKTLFSVKFLRIYIEVMG